MYIKCYGKVKLTLIGTFYLISEFLLFLIDFSFKQICLFVDTEI